MENKAMWQQRKNGKYVNWLIRTVTTFDHGVLIQKMISDLLLKIQVFGESFLGDFHPPPYYDVINNIFGQ